jgi:hypothetical protein
MNLLNLINPSLAHIYCSTILSNHELIMLNLDSPFKLLFISSLYLIFLVTKHSIRQGLKLSPCNQKKDGKNYRSLSKPSKMFSRKSDTLTGGRRQRRQSLHSTNTPNISCKRAQSKMMWSVISACPQLLHSILPG